MNNTSFIITGANGWLGHGLMQALFEGVCGIDKIGIDEKVRILLLPNESNKDFIKYGSRVEAVYGNLQNKEDCKKLFKDTKNVILYHLAGIIHPKRIKEFYDVNLNGTKNLLNEAEKAKVKKAIIVSSNSCIGCNPFHGHIFDEISPYNPYMNYGKSKMLMEMEVKNVQKRKIIETVIIRTPWFYGPFQPQRQTLFFKMIRDGKFPIIGSGNNLRSMAYIDNLVQGLIKSSLSEKSNGKIYWIADNRPYSMNEIIDTVRNVLEKEFDIKCSKKTIKLPNIIGEVAYYCDKLIQSVGLYHQKIHVLSEMNKSIACSVELAKKELNYNPTINLYEGMKKSVAWMIDNGENINVK